MPRALLALLLPTLTGACSDLRDAYGKEYVLYDSRGPAPAEQPAAHTATPATFARILVLEQVRAELERTILDGLDPDGALTRKRREVEAELQHRIAEAGADLAAWRAQRARELAQFSTQ